jgi:hypothetical protein
MYECVFRSRRDGDSGVVPSELSIGAIQRRRHPRHFRRGKWVLFFLGFALCACAGDSTADNNHHRRHRHGSEDGREKSETVDRSSDSSHSTPTPALGW